MKEIPFNVPVECTDGRGGKSVSLIVHPTELRVTHIIVSDTSFPPVERMVLVEHISDTSPEMIQLNCTKHMLANMERFIERHYIKSNQDEEPQSYMQPYATPVESGYIRIEEHHVPPGELEVKRGTRVSASDGEIGEIGELLLDPDSGKITHLILLKGHVWGDTEISLPLSAIDHVAEDTVYLKLDKKAIQSLPAVPVKRAWKDIHGADLDLVILVFEQIDGGDKALDSILRYAKENQFVTLNSAILTKDLKGDIQYKESADVDAKHGAFFGAFVGGLIGLTRGPVGGIAGAVTGAATGGVTAHLVDMGFPNEELQSLSKTLEKGSSALVILIEHQWVEEALKQIEDLNPEVWMKKISDELVSRYLEDEV
jgi:uncharacterized membrane protein